MNQAVLVMTPPNEKMTRLRTERVDAIAVPTTY